MNLTITQSEFESVLYVATSKHMEVFNSVEPYIEKAKIECVDYFFGGTETDDGRTITCAKDYICLDAFLNVFRQLDLVLTPTGFGVVANNTTSPASRQRVDALELQLKVSREKAKGRLIDNLTKVEGWGKTAAAQRCIRTVFYSIIIYEWYSTKPVSLENWLAAQLDIMEADMKLRRKISSAQMDKVLESVRNGTVNNDYSALLVRLQEFVSFYIDKSPMIGEKMNTIIHLMEKDPSNYKEYMESNAYKVNHHEPFENEKDSPGFFFVG